MMQINQLVNVIPIVRGVARIQNSFDFKPIESAKISTAMNAPPMGNVSRTDHQKINAPEQINIQVPSKREKGETFRARSVRKTAAVEIVPEVPISTRPNIMGPVWRSENKKDRGLKKAANRGWVWFLEVSLSLASIFCSTRLMSASNQKSHFS